jgi:DNA-binding transcriptional MerR regulator
MNGNQGIMRIGEVHAQLRKYFPDIELSKIRYYEDKGLVQPSRSRKGYRLYSERDVECLREAIRLAQEEFVPLRVVRLRLIEQGLLKDVPVPSSPRHAAREAISNVVSIPAPPTPTAQRPNVEGRAAERRRHGRRRRALPLDGGVLGHDRIGAGHAVTQLHALGLLAPVLLGNEISFTEFDVRVAAARGGCSSAASTFASSARCVASPSARSVSSKTSRRRCEPRAADSPANRPRDVTVELAAEVGALRAVLYERALQDYLGR